MPKVNNLINYIPLPKTENLRSYACLLSEQIYVRMYVQLNKEEN